MLSKEEVLEIISYCDSHKINRSDRLQELGISHWNFYKSPRHHLKAEKSYPQDNMGSFIQRKHTGKISKVKHCILFTDNTIPVVYHRLVHLISAFERTLTELDDVNMIEMGVRCEEHLITVKFVVHCLLFLLWHPVGSWWLLKRLLLLSPLLIVVEKVKPIWTQKTTAGKFGKDFPTVGVFQFVCFDD